MSQPAQLLFDLTPTEEQALMRETVRRFVATEVTPHARKADEGAAPPEGFYEKSAELGFTAVAIPEALGGFGAPRSPVSNVLIAEDLAYGDMALAIGAMSSLSFVNAVLDFGSEAQRAALLPAFASEGFRPAALAWMEPTPRFDPAVLSTKAQRAGSGFVLRGEKTMVPLAGSAESLLVIATEEGAGPAAFVVQRGSKGLSCAREAFMGLRPLELCRVTLDDVHVDVDNKLAAFDCERLVHLTRIGIAALSVGVCQAVLDYVKRYCNDRVAFGEPITHRQSVAFMIADIAIELDAMRLMVYRAAARAEQGLPFRRQAYLAHLQCADKAMQIATDGVQLLGGHGFIREHLVELYYRNLRAVAVLAGCVAV